MNIFENSVFQRLDQILHSYSPDFGGKLEVLRAVNVFFCASLLITRFYEMDKPGQTKTVSILQKFALAGAKFPDLNIY